MPVTAPAGQSETIVILDFGSQYAQLIARRVRDNGVYSVLARPDVSAEEIRRLNPKGLIFTGGPNSVYEPGAAMPAGGVRPGRADPGDLLRHADLLRTSGRQGQAGAVARVRANDSAYFPAGRAAGQRAGGDDRLDEPRRPGEGVGRRISFPWRHAHLPAGGRCGTKPGRSTACSSTRKSRTRRTATQIFVNFLYEICGCAGLWKMGSFIDAAVETSARRSARTSG